MRSGTQMLQDVEPFITCFSSLLRLKRGNSYRGSLAEHPQSASVSLPLTRVASGLSVSTTDLAKVRVANKHQVLRSFLIQISI